MDIPSVYTSRHGLLARICRTRSGTGTYVTRTMCTCISSNLRENGLASLSRAFKARVELSSRLTKALKTFGRISKEFLLSGAW